MKIKYSFLYLILGLSSFSLSAQDGIGIQFDVNEKFEELVFRAKNENKLIFIDVYATWCAPCKRMEKEVYSRKDVGDFFESKFLAWKVQIDSGKSDPIKIQNMYPAYKTFLSRYPCNVYPTYFFINGEGDVIHKGIGYMNAKDFLKFSSWALDTSSSSEILRANYQDGDSSSSFLLRYSSILKGCGERELASEIFTNFLGTKADWSSPAIVFGIIDFVEDANTEGYRFLLRNRERFITELGFEIVFNKQKNIAMKEIMPFILPSTNQYHENISSINKTIEECFNKPNEIKFMKRYTNLIYLQLQGKEDSLVDAILTIPPSNFKFLNDVECYGFAKVIFSNSTTKEDLQFALELVNISTNIQPLEKYMALKKQLTEKL